MDTATLAIKKKEGAAIMVTTMRNITMPAAIIAINSAIITAGAAAERVVAR